MHEATPPTSDKLWPQDPRYDALFRIVERVYGQLIAEEFDTAPPPPARFVLISEWSRASSGDFLRAWVRDSGGLRLLPTKAAFQTTAGPQPNPRLGFEEISFHVSDDGQHLDYTHQWGRRAASGETLRLDPVTLEVHGMNRWLS